MGSISRVLGISINTVSTACSSDSAGSILAIRPRSRRGGPVEQGHKNRKRQAGGGGPADARMRGVGGPYSLFRGLRRPDGTASLP